MRISIVLILLYSLGACSGETEHEQRRALLRVPEAQKRPRVVSAASKWFDDKGNLRPSEQKVAGLALPRGLELKRETKLRHFYETEVAANKLHWYFSARLASEKIRKVSGSTTYIAAKLSDGSDSTARFDVKITPSRIPKGKTHLEIQQLAPRKPTPPLPQLMKQLERKRGVID